MNHIMAIFLASSDYVHVTTQLHKQNQGLPIYAFLQTHSIIFDIVALDSVQTEGQLHSSHNLQNETLLYKHNFLP